MEIKPYKSTLKSENRSSSGTNQETGNWGLSVTAFCHNSVNLEEELEFHVKK